MQNTSTTDSNQSQITDQPVSPPTQSTAQPTSEKNKTENRTPDIQKAEAAQSQAEPMVSSSAPSVEKVATPKISSGIIFNSIREINTDTRIGEEFGVPEAQTGYIEKQWESEQLNTAIPFLDENIDKPRVEMDFYAPGLEGSVERFFDKITYKKQFTTKYGTKIYCANVAFLVMCSWK